MDIREVGLLESRTSSIPGQRVAPPGAGGNQTDFKTLLQERASAGLNFSKHAARRMNERGIAVDSQLMSNLEHAVEGARKKGARDVAIIGQQGVFIVNVPNNTVVTTMSQDDMRERVFTNIDSAVLM
ncbi:MAG: flagellar operon protein [Hungatella sp.]|nr:flagellar operon protein [Hungatella sp.]